MRAIVMGAGGFIGSHLVRRLKGDGCWVRGVDLKHPEFGETAADEFVIGDLRDPVVCDHVLRGAFDEAYQLAADMGGAGYLFTGDNDAAILHNSALINLNVAHMCRQHGIGRVFYSSSACVYPEYNQIDEQAPVCREDTVYPAEPDSEYGWEKLFSERLYLSYAKNYGIRAKIARYHNVFGPCGTWRDGREKVPAALCRKVKATPDGGAIEIWGDGNQTRSFLYVDDCVEATVRLMRHPTFDGPVNIGSEHLISINELARLIIRIGDKTQDLVHVDGPIGVRGRNSHNALIGEHLDWQPALSLEEGLTRTYAWIAEQIAATGYAEALPA